MKNVLTTVYSEQMNKENPWNEYPRPQMKRSSFLSLNGLWDFEISRSHTPPESLTEKILVPFPPESSLSGIERTHENGEYLYYRRKFTLPDGFKKDSVLMHFGAVDQECEVFINDVRVGYNFGGYLPFSFDITKNLRDGENTVTVKATDNLSKIYPYGKQCKKRGGMWYTEVSGIWQTVWLESLPEKPIKSLKISPSLDSVTIKVDTEATNKTITLKDSGEVFSFTEDSIVIRPKEIKNWSPESPYLYHFTLATETDAVESYFALREISVKTVGGVSKICLNGKPYLFHGLLDQGYFPDGIFLPATSDGYKDDILRCKALGFNMLRKHIKIEPDIFYYLCDTLGMAVFQDMVNNSDYSFFRDTALPTIGMKRLSDKFLHKNKSSRTRFSTHMIATSKHLYNFPSILYYTIFNEGWGQHTADSHFMNLKVYEADRIVDSTSGWFHQKWSDVISHHVYFKKLKAKISDKKPVVISEFGGYSHRVKDHVFGDENYGYKTFESRDAFEDAVIKLYNDEVLPLVKAGASAFVYTQVSDIEDETNGFYTYDRRVLKISEDKFKEISDKLYSAHNEVFNDGTKEIKDSIAFDVFKSNTK